MGTLNTSELLDIIGSLTNCVEKLRDISLEAIAELNQYKDAEEQGLLLRLPCKVGDWLYYPCPQYNVVVPIRLNDVSISFLGLENYSYQYKCCSFDGCGDVYEDYEFDNADIGKTVFLTKEEAEKKLAERKKV